MVRPVLSSLVLLPLAGLIAGCHAGPAPSYQPRLTLASLAPGLPTPENTYALVAEPETHDRFPCTLAVAQLAPAQSDSNPPLTLVAMTAADRARWAETFRGMSAIRDLVFLSPRSLMSDGEGVDGCISAAARVNAPLLLLYVANRTGPNTAQVLGILYDVGQRSPLATLHASAHFLDSEGEERPPEPRQGDWRDSDAGFQSIRAFESSAVACLRDQIRRDVRSTVPEPHRWTPLYPYYQPMLPAPGSQAPASQPVPTLPS